MNDLSLKVYEEMFRGAVDFPGNGRPVPLVHVDRSPQKARFLAQGFIARVLWDRALDHASFEAAAEIMSSMDFNGQPLPKRRRK